MPPRDIFDINPVYSRRFYWPYCEFINNHSDQIGFYPAQLLDESEVWVDDTEEVDDMDIDRNESNEEEDIHTSMQVAEVWDSLSPEVRRYYEALFNLGGFEREEIASTDESSDDDEDEGTRDNPIDLTCNEDMDTV